MSMVFRNHAHEFYIRKASAEDAMSKDCSPRHCRGILLATLALPQTEAKGKQIFSKRGAKGEEITSKPVPTGG